MKNYMRGGKKIFNSAEKGLNEFLFWGVENRMKFLGEANIAGFVIRNDSFGIEVKSQNYNEGRGKRFGNAEELKALRKWHAAEHKLVYVLGHDQPITLEGLKKAPMESVGCSANNGYLEEPGEKHLSEAIRVGLECIRRIFSSFQLVADDMYVIANVEE